jgi:hypothetical protein
MLAVFYYYGNLSIAYYFTAFKTALEVHPHKFMTSFIAIWYVKRPCLTATNPAKNKAVRPW